MVGYVSWRVELVKFINPTKSWKCKIHFNVFNSLIIFRVILLMVFFSSHKVLSNDLLTIPMDLSKWEYKGSKTQCAMFHIDAFVGKFYFLAKRGDKVSFISDIRNRKNKWQTITLTSQSAPWSVEPYKKVISTINAPMPASRFVFDKGVDKLLESIATGDWVMLSLGGINTSSSLEITIPTIRLGNTLESFNACRARLPKLSFSEARNLVLSFDFGQKALSRKQQETLAALNSYVSVDDRVTKILIDGHTDNVGSSLANLSVSRTRAEQVAEALVELGIDKSMIETRAHGSRYPIASNNSTRGQAKNRRVTLRLVRDNERTAVKHHPDVQQQNQQTKVKVQ